GRPSVAAPPWNSTQGRPRRAAPTVTPNTGEIPMRKVRFGGANSLDNFFARKDDSVDWLLWSKEVEPIMKDYWNNIDTVVMGRRTYEVAMKNYGSVSSGPGIKTYIF